MAEVAASLPFAMAFFLGVGGLWPALALIGLVLFVIRRDAVWLASVIGAAFAAYSVHMLFQVPEILNANTVGQIYAMQALLGGLLILAVISLVSIGTKALMTRRAKQSLETHS